MRVKTSLVQYSLPAIWQRMGGHSLRKMCLEIQTFFREKALSEPLLAGHLALAGPKFRRALVANGVVRPLTRLMLEGRSASAAAESSLAADTAAWALSHVVQGATEVHFCLCCLRF